MKSQRTERIDIRGRRIHSESNKLPGHDARMIILCAQAEAELKKNKKRKKK